MRFLLLIIFSLYSAAFSSTQSRNFYENFYNEFVSEQRQYLAANHLTSPAPTGYVPFTITNSSTAPDAQVYVLILTNNFTNIITFTTSAAGLAVGASVTPPPSTYVSQMGSGTYPLNFFPQNADGSYTFYLPSTVNMASSRIYYSVGEPLDWFIPYVGAVLVPAQDFSDPSQDGYYILFDKQEFTMVANDRLIMNPTLVDYYGLPLSFSITYNTSTVQYAGLPPTLSSSTIFSNYTTAIATRPSTPMGGTEPVWEALYLTYAPPSGMSGPLRVLSPNQGIQTLSPLLTNPIFPIDYFLTNDYTNCNWLSTVWFDAMTPAIYQGQPLYIDLSTVGPSYGVAQGQVDGSGSFNFTAISGTGTGSTLNLPLPTSSRAFFTSTLADYLPAPTQTGDANVATAIWQIFSAAVISGVIPVEGTTAVAPLSQSYLRSQTLFANNSLLSCLNPTPPYYDFYSGTFIGMGSGNYTKFYTTPYGDVLGTDGTITVTNISTAGAQVAVNIGSISGITIPNPFNDNNTYTVIFSSLPANVLVTFGTSPNFSTNPAVSSSGQTFNSVAGATMYMGVTYQTGNYTGQVWGTHIIPSAPAPKPVLPGGLALDLTSGTLTITLGGPP